MKWHSVKDKLPPDEHYVLTCGESGIWCCLQYIAHGVWYSYDGRTDYEVTHWMELPELPNRK